MSAQIEAELKNQSLVVQAEVKANTAFLEAWLNSPGDPVAKLLSVCLLGARLSESADRVLK